MLEAEQQRSDQRLNPLVRHNDDPDPAGILQTIRGEVDALARSIEEPHIGLAEVELRKLARYPLKAHHQLRGQLLLFAPVHAIEGTLTHAQAPLAQQAQVLQRRRLRIRSQQVP
jgi:hypothetical protein